MKLNELEYDLGVVFQDKALLRLALTHSSYLNENPETTSESNERLEFLGDAVIGCVIGKEMYRRHPNWTEGQLTQARSVLVRGSSLSQIATKLKLGDHLMMGSGELSSGGSQRSSNLEATFEAIVGALFLDKGYQDTSDFILRIFSDQITAIDTLKLTNPKSALQESAHSIGWPTPEYSIVQKTGTELAPNFWAEVRIDGRVMGEGVGLRKSEAEQNAAKIALGKLKRVDHA